MFTLDVICDLWFPLIGICMFVYYMSRQIK